MPIHRPKVNIPIFPGRHNKERDEAFLRLRTRLETGAAQAGRGELLDGDEVFEELREILEERRRARIPAVGVL